MMRKWIASGLIFVMLFSLTGCQSMPDALEGLLRGEAGQNVIRTDEEGQEADDNIRKPEEGLEDHSGEAFGEEPEREVVENGQIRYRIQRRWDNAYDYSDDGDYVGYAYMDYEMLEIDPDSARKLADSVNALFADTEKLQKSEFEEMVNNAKWDYEEGHLYSAYYDNTYLSVTRSDTAVFSFYGYNEGYWNGAHGYYGIGGYVYDSETGEPLTWRDFFTCSDEEMTRLLIRRVEEDYRDELDGFFDYQDMIEKEVTNYEESDYVYELNFYADNCGITFIFNPYEIACYAAGMQCIQFSYEEYEDILNPRYTTLPASYCIPFSGTEYAPFVYDIDKDGQQDEVLVAINKDEYDMGESVTVTVNGKEQTFEAHCFEVTPLFVYREEENLLILRMVSENDWQFNNVYAIEKNGKLREVASFDGNLDDCVNPLCFPYERRMNIMSTYSAMVPASMDADGTPVLLEDYYQITSELSIVSTVDLTLPGLDIVDLRSVGDVTIPAGSEFVFRFTDGKTGVCAFVDGCGYVWLEPKKDPDFWIGTLNGRPADECFEMLYFAG